MKNKLDKVIIVDIESSAWDGPVPSNQFSDIIEIGVCLLDPKTFEITQPNGIIVRPERSTVSPFCTKLTTITQEMVDKGTSFSSACRTLSRDYNASRRVWASWGDYDRKQFHKNCDALNVKYPFSDTHINIKNLFALMLGYDHEMGMDTALKAVNMELEGTHHRALPDALNIAKLLTHLLMLDKH